MEKCPCNTYFLEAAVLALSLHDVPHAQSTAAARAETLHPTEDLGAAATLLDGSLSPPVLRSSHFEFITKRKQEALLQKNFVL